MIEGACACGRIKYKTEQSPISCTACHCQQCRETGGGPYLPFVDFDTDQLKWSQYPEIWKYSEAAQRFFCNICGSSLGMQYFFELGKIGITMGTIQKSDQPIPKYESHIFLKEKASWFDVPNDGTRKWDGFNQEFTARFDKWNSDQDPKTKNI